MFHPLFAYEIFWNMAGVAVIVLLEHRILFVQGRAFGLYLIWYGLGRSWLEGIRIDPSSDAVLGIPVNVLASFVAIAIGLTILFAGRRQHPQLTAGTPPYA